MSKMAVWSGVFVENLVVRVCSTLSLNKRLADGVGKESSDLALKREDLGSGGAGVG